MNSLGRSTGKNQAAKTLQLVQELSGTPSHCRHKWEEAYCGTNRRHILQYKLEAHCGVSLPRLGSQRGAALEMGDAVRRALPVLFRQVVRVGGS